MGAITSSLRKNLPFLKEHKGKIIFYGLPYFVEECDYVFILFPAIEEFYYKSILVEMFIRTAINRPSDLVFSFRLKCYVHYSCAHMSSHIHISKSCHISQSLII